MTGYARVEGTHDSGDGAAQWQWSWEVKSVNGKGLDIRFRLPGGFDALEIPARKLIGTKLGRGSLSVSLMLSRQTTSKALTGNRELIEQILELQGTLEAEGKIYPSPPRLDSLLSVRGILETEEEPAQDPAQKEADIREEVDRLDAHVAACRDLVNAGGVIGRKLDFICQELNRESNTICSKAASLALTNIGLELKSTVEQFREQVQNVE